jgi:3'(2'), 5'-bisphosphate nucleotidase
VKHVQEALVSPALTKEDRSPVTVADYASQSLIGYLLSQEFPGDPLVAEEDSQALRDPQARRTLDQVTHFVGQFTAQADPETVCDWIDHGRVDSAGRFWTLDPVDGTKGFLRGDQYAVALALIVEGQVKIGVLGCPNLSDAHQLDAKGPGSLVVAIHNQGTWASTLSTEGKFTRLRVSQQTDPAHARLLRSFESGHTNVSQIDTFVQEMGIKADPVRLDSQAKYALLASGQGELYLRLLSQTKPDYREKIWDQAAGSLVLEEAGGCITDLLGNPLDFTTGRTLARNRGILASNRLLHTAALSALKNIGV